MTPAIKAKVMAQVMVVGAFVLCAIACQAGVKAVNTELSVKAAYTADAGEVLQNNASPEQYTIYIEELANTSIGPPTFNHEKRLVTYASGKFVEGPIETATEQEMKDHLMGLEGDRSDVVDRLKSGVNPYYISKDISIGTGAKADASIALQGDMQVASKVVLHINGVDYHRDYDGGFVRAIYPVAGKQGTSDLGVIIDYCGTSSCYSEIEVVNAGSK